MILESDDGALVGGFEDPQILKSSNTDFTPMADTKTIASQEGPGTRFWNWLTETL